MEPKLDEARERSRSVWDAMAPGWENFRQDLWELSRPVSEWLVERLDPRPGQTILDLAGGLGETGFLAARRVGETGRILVTDFAPRMVAAARRRAAEFSITNADFRELDGERMALESECVDGVVCRWGYMLMADLPKRLALCGRAVTWSSRSSVPPTAIPGPHSSVGFWWRRDTSRLPLLGRPGSSR